MRAAQKILPLVSMWLLLASLSFVLVSVFTRLHSSRPLPAFLPKYLGSASFPRQHGHTFNQVPVLHLALCGVGAADLGGTPPRTPACPSLCFRSLGPIPLLFEDAFKLVFVL